MSTTTLLEPGHVAIGLIARLAADGVPLVSLPGAARPRRVETVAGLTRADLDRARTGTIPVLVTNVDGRLVVLGFLATALPAPAAPTAAPAHQIIAAEESVTISCGKASLTLTKAGKVLIEGEYLGTRTRGATRVRGGSVQIN